jgi:hypothetical protein
VRGREGKTKKGVDREIECVCVCECDKERESWKRGLNISEG